MGINKVYTIQASFVINTVVCYNDLKMYIFVSFLSLDRLPGPTAQWVKLHRSVVGLLWRSVFGLL